MRWFVLPDGASPDVQQKYAVVLAIHAALLPSGYIIYFGGDEHDPVLWDNHDVHHTRLFNCTTLSVEPFDPGSPDGDVFCCGHAMLGDGKLLVAGGTEVFVGQAPGIHHDHMPGLRDASTYDPWARMWSAIEPMIDPFPKFPRPGSHLLRPEGGRWYPTLVTVQDGSVVALCGHPSNQDARHNNHIPERFVPSLQSWIQLEEPPTNQLEVTDDTRLYPRVHLLPNGSLFCSTPLGTIPRSQLIDPWKGSRQFVADAPPIDTQTGDPALVGPDGKPIAMPSGVYWGNSFTQCATSVLLPLVPPHYAPRILICGGRKAYVIDLQGVVERGETHSRWLQAGGRGLDVPRFHLNAVLLPTGDVFVCGGVNVFNHDVNGVNVPEIYHPETNSWSTLTSAPANVVRNYHSVALLMPDGRIWTAGSDHNGGQGVGNADLRIEIFEPDYVGRSDRPTITWVTDSVICGETFDVETPDPESIGRVAVIRTGSVTHSFNSDQRYVRLDFKVAAPGHLSVIAPPNGRVAPPGSYLLFLLNKSGIPSKGRFVHIGMHQQHVFYRNVADRIEHIFWDEPTEQLYHDNWTDRARELDAAGEPCAMLTPFQQHVFYRATDSSIRHILWDGRQGNIFHDNWTSRANAPGAAGDPCVMTTAHQQHVFYRTGTGAIHHILWDDRTARGFFDDDWTFRARAPFAAGDPATLVTPNQQHIFYRTRTGAIHHILWDDRTAHGFFHDDWTAAVGAPAAGGNPVTMLTPHQQHVFYRTVTGAIHHILWDDRTAAGFFHDDWTAAVGAPAAAGDPVTMLTSHQQHIFYRSEDGHIEHILWDDRAGAGFFHDSWTQRTHAPRAAAGPAVMVTPHQQHIFYRDVDGQIQHILWDEWPQDFYHDNWTARTGAPLAAGRPVTMMTRV